MEKTSSINQKRKGRTYHETMLTNILAAKQAKQSAIYFGPSEVRATSGAT
jgi:hypothetical protein